MRNKILRLVLNKQESRKKVLLNKHEGNVTSLISGLMIMTIIIIILMFNYRVMMLSEVLYNIEDAVTAAALGGATPNYNEYTTSTSYPTGGQLVMHAPTTSTTTTYNSTEQVVSNSEAASGSIQGGFYNSTSSVTGPTVKSFGLPSGYSSYVQYKSDIRTISVSDVTTLATINNVSNLMYSNITNSTVGASRVSATNNSSAIANAMTVSKQNVVNKSFLGSYTSSNIDVTRMEVYNIYRYTLARRHVYASPFFTYTVNGVGGYTWDGYNVYGTSVGTPITLSNGVSTRAVRDMVNMTQYIDGTRTGAITISISGYQIDNEETLKDVIQARGMLIDIPGRVTVSSHPDAPVITPNYTAYNIILARYNLDMGLWGSRASLVFFEDAGATYQSDWWSASNTLKRNYGFMWDNNTSTAIPIYYAPTGADNLVHPTKAEGGVRNLLPIEGYSSYLYIKDRGILTAYNNFSSSNGVLNANCKQPITLGDYNKATSSGADDYSTAGTVYANRKTNASLYYSSVYVEAAYDVFTFPRNEGAGDNMWHLSEFGKSSVLTSKLVSLTIKDQ